LTFLIYPDIKTQWLGHSLMLTVRVATKAQRIDLPAIALARPLGFASGECRAGSGEFPNSGTRKQVGMSFTPYLNKNNSVILVTWCVSG
jgi:hypothetical protein